MITLEKKYNPKNSESHWQQHWETNGTHDYDPKQPREASFVIDTPPPTVSGQLHMGHIFSYTQTDFIARFWRMSGKNVFYPMGWDNNGLPTERRVQNHFGIKCDPAQANQADFAPKPVDKKNKRFQSVSRHDFLKACHQLTEEDQVKYKSLWQRMGLSIDWHQQYATIDKRSRRISQASFCDLHAKGLVQHRIAPTLWDTGFQTAVAQAEVEDREQQGLLYEIELKSNTDEPIVIATTRPELLPACIAVVAHPEDERYQHLFGKTAITPLFHMEVPIMPSTHADREKGTGILMVCTFGDLNDVAFWKANDLPLRQIISRSGQLNPIEFGSETFPSLAPNIAEQHYATLCGDYVKVARRKMVELLAVPQTSLLNDGPALQGEPQAIKQMVKFYEKGDYALEYIPTRQWFIDILSDQDNLASLGDQLTWKPGYMKKRYQQWVAGLNQDWCISRQRYFGVPFPVWYPLDAKGEKCFDQPILADGKDLPVDPATDTPPGYEADQRDQAHGFTADSDVMDTWATSALTPLINSHWTLDEDRHQQLYPADLRPQGHEIIRTWTFYTICKAWMHTGELPWHTLAISGWVVNPDHSKMSKSKGNTVTPDQLIEQYSADALRYWAGRAKLGQDTVYDPSVFTIGQKLINKLFNVTKFVINQAAQLEQPPKANDIIAPLDQAWCRHLDALVEQATTSMTAYDYASALNAIETAFWAFCDDLVELIKIRSYDAERPDAQRSAIACLNHSLSVFLRLFAPFIPHITETLWQASQNSNTSIHRSAWPKTAGLHAGDLPTGILSAAVDIIESIRTEKAKHQKSLKWPVQSLTINANSDTLKAIDLFMDDIVSAGHVEKEAIRLKAHESDDMVIEVQLAEHADPA